MAEDFHGADLQGQSFKECDLTGRDFCDADIRGAKFDQAILINANFSQVKSGLQSYWILIWVLASYLLAMLAGFLCSQASFFVTSLLTNKNVEELGELRLLPGLFTLAVFALFLVLTIVKGVRVALLTIASILIVTAFASIIFDRFVVGKFAFIPTFIALVLSIAILLLATGIGAIAVKLTDTTTFKKIKKQIVVIWIIMFVSAIIITKLLHNELLGLIIFVAIAEVSCLIIYLNYKTTNQNKELAWIARIVVAIVAKTGTSFKGADLTNANFTAAILENTDFRQANLTHTCWLHARKLDYACVEGTYLQEKDVRQLLLDNNAEGKNFKSRNLVDLNLQNANLSKAGLNGANLDRANLSQANLSKASLIGANLNQANLSQANLSGAKLVRAQLYRADLTKTCLTGAYIQDWGISSETKLEQVKCEYAYMHLPTETDPDPCRKPDNKKENFQEGDFSKFIAPIITTLNLYRSQDVDMREVANTFKTIDLFYSEGIDNPSAAVLALQQTAEEYPEAGIEVLALEGRGNQKIRIQAKVSETANRSEVSAAYSKKLRQIKNLSESDIDALITEKAGQSQENQWLRKMLEVLINQDRFYIENVHNQGEFVMSQNTNQSRNVEISGGTVNATGAGAFSLGDISGTVANTINKLPDSPQQDEPGIKELLIQLQEAIEASSELDEEDKAEALAQIETLAQAGKDPKEESLQKPAKTAMKIIRGTVSCLPNAANLVEACTKLLPEISKLLLL